MTLPRMHDEREWCLFHNDLGQSVGECALEVRGWLAEHPEYQGRIYGDWDTGGPRDDFDATELFETLLAENAKRREKLDATLTDLARGDKDFRPVKAPREAA